MKELVCIPFDGTEEMNKFLSRHILREDVVNVESRFFGVKAYVYAEGETLQIIKRLRRRQKKEDDQSTLLLIAICFVLCVLFAVWNYLR